MAKQNNVPGAQESILVVGLGRFGSAVCRSLVQLGHDVLAIDENPDLVTRWAQELGHVVEADATDETALRQLGADKFKRAVVAIGTDLEASVLTVLSLTEIGLTDIWAKAITRKHGKILEHIGARHVIFPETAMGERVAHMVTGQMIDFIEFQDGYAIARTRAPKEAFGRTLAEAALRTRYGITVVGLKRPGFDFTYARPETKVHERDELVVSGPTEKVERFSALAAIRRWT